MTDTVLALTQRSDRRDQLAGLIAQLDDADLDEAIMLMEWLLDPRLRAAVDDLATMIWRAKGQHLGVAD